MNFIDPDSSFEHRFPSGLERKYLDKEILDTFPSSIFITDLESHILFWNRVLDIWLVQEPIEKYGGYISIHNRIQMCPNAGAMVKVWFLTTILNDYCPST